jgi:hypothetical protein
VIIGDYFDKRPVVIHDGKLPGPADFWAALSPSTRDFK